METSCVFCCTTANNNSPSDIKAEEYWPYIQRLQWKGNSPLQLNPPMCTVCSENIEEIAKCHREIVKLEQKLNMIRKQLDEAAEDVRERMEKCKLDSRIIIKCRGKRSPDGSDSGGVKRSFDEMMSSASSTLLSPGSKEHVLTGNSPQGSIEIETDGVMEKTETVEEGCNPPKISISEETGDEDDDNDDCVDYKLEVTSNSNDYESEQDIISEPAPSKRLNDPLEDSKLAVPRVIVRRKIPRACQICGMKLPLTDLFPHMKGHVGDFAFQCPTCSITFPSRYSYSYNNKNHRRLCPEIKSKFKCELCHSTEVKFGYALRHLLTIHENEEEKNFTCPLPSCGERFTWKQSVELHLGEHEIMSKNYRHRTQLSKEVPHCEKDSSIPLSHANTRDKCLICGLKLPLGDLYNHMRGHVGDYAFQCESCWVTFPSRYSFAYFFWMHAKMKCKNIQRKIKCELCHHEFRYGQAYVHFHAHENETPDPEKINSTFPCSIPSCGKTFKWKQSLELHLGEHEQKAGKVRKSRQNFVDKSICRRRQCEICGESIPLTNLHEHLVSHVGEELAFRCPGKKNKECNVSFASRYSRACIDLHLDKRNHCEWTPPKICEECNECFENLVGLRPHLKRHEMTSEKNFICPITNCKEGFTIKQSLEFHLSSHKFVRNVQCCTMCPNKRLSPSEMEAHLRDQHGVQSVLRCTHCPFVYSSQEDLVDHLAGHAKSGSGVKCHLCPTDKIFEYGGTLRKHYLKEHQIGKQYLCESCEFSTVNLKILKDHKRRIHGLEGRSQKFVCEICEDRPAFMCSDTLTTHNIKMHNAEKFQCKLCSKTFVQRAGLNNYEKLAHRSSEVERRKFPCPHCDMVLMGKRTLAGHINTIHSKQVYKCSNCEKSYKNPKSLEMHVKRNHEGVSKCVCETCGKAYLDKNILKVHMRIHTGERPYLCKLCGMAFRQQAAWRTHSKGHERKGDKFASRGTFDRTPKHPKMTE